MDAVLWMLFSGIHQPSLAISDHIYLFALPNRLSGTFDHTLLLSDAVSSVVLEVLGRCSLGARSEINILPV